MLILGIDTATSTSSIALYETRSNSDLGVVSSPSTAKHSESLIPEIDRLLAKNHLDYKSIDLIAVAIGPGSFTGLRVGLSTAKGFAYALKKPIVALDSLMFRAFAADPSDAPVAVCFDAKKGEVFGAIFKLNNKLSPPEILFSSRIFTIDDFTETCNSLHVKTLITDLPSNVFPQIFEINIKDLDERCYNSIYLCILANIIYSIDGSNDINTLSPKYLVDFVPGTTR